MAKKSKGEKTVETTHYRHDEARRKNIPSAAMEAEGKVPSAKRVKYAYSPHLDPVLRFDPLGRADKVSAIVNKACRGERLSAPEQEILQAVGRNWEQPWLEWAGKQEEHARGHFSVDPVALHIHERISAQAILRNAMREDAQRSLFGDPEQTYAEALQFYKHDVDWANRLILGDSLQVMSSLATRENMAGKVQMIYLDPPYGIRFGSNFQPELGRKDVKDGKDEDLTREAEMVRAYRDTWHLGVSSYLSYLRDRLQVAHQLLSDTGSIFVQIGDEQQHSVRTVLDEVFGRANFVTLITVKKTAGLGKGDMAAVCDYLVWYAKRQPDMTRFTLATDKDLAEDDAYPFVLSYDGELLRKDSAESQEALERIARLQILLAAGRTPSCVYPVGAFGRTYMPTAGRSWSTNPSGMARLLSADRVRPAGSSIAYLRLGADNPINPISNLWSDTASGSGMDKAYVVQTNTKVIERCMLMTTKPGDLVVDPTCGSGTSAFVAEQWGRRWITIDTSRVALAIARQRLLTSRFDHYRTKGTLDPLSGTENPASGFSYRRVSRVTLGAIAQNTHLDPIFERHDPILSDLLQRANAVLATINSTVVERLSSKLAAKQEQQGKRSITESDRRRWLLPPGCRDQSATWSIDQNFRGWYEWEIPFDTDPDWPKELKEAVAKYRTQWRAKMAEVSQCIAGNAETEDLVDQPEVARNVVRVSGPFTVEGVIPEEMSLREDGAFDPTPNGNDEDVRVEAQNLSSYLARMVSHLRADGLTFLNNQRKQFGRLDSTFEEGSGSFLHAEGSWADDETSVVAVTFGPQYGPVTALQVEEAIRASKRCTDLVVAGFSFDAETYAIVEAQQHPKLRIHIAQIRPDLNESMDGLLKNTPNSQLFSVFGQPDIKVKHTKDGWVCELEGVVIYNPADNTIRSANADKVAAWFLDSDYDGRCFCATQAFFPDRDAWEKIAKALGSQADAEAFEAFNGTKSLPFEKGKHARIAVKVIDPRGNEVMAIRRLQ